VYIFQFAVEGKVLHALRKYCIWLTLLLSFVLLLSDASKCHAEKEVAPQINCLSRAYRLYSSTSIIDYLRSVYKVLTMLNCWCIQQGKDTDWDWKMKVKLNTFISFVLMSPSVQRIGSSKSMSLTIRLVLTCAPRSVESINFLFMPL